MELVKRIKALSQAIDEEKNMHVDLIPEHQDEHMHYILGMEFALEIILDTK